MAALSRLLKVSSMTDALGVYVPAMIAQKAVGLGRLVLLAYMMSRVPHQYGMWGLGLMVATLAMPLMAVGAGQGIRRYVSYYEARGQLEAFYRPVRWFVPVVCVATGCVAMAFSGPITRAVIVSRAHATDLPFRQQLAVCMAALANAAVMAMHQGVVGFMAGMRAYRLVSVLEVFLSVLFTALACGAVAMEPTGLAVLWAHFSAVTVALVLGTCALGVLVRRSPGGHRAGEGCEPTGILRRLVRFGLGAMLAVLSLAAAQSVSLYIVNRWEGKAAAGIYALFAQLSQPVFFIACAAGTVIMTHSAARWEGGDRHGAMRRMQTGYKAVAMGTMTLAVGVLAAAPLWLQLLPGSFRGGGQLLGGLLMFFQSLTHLAVITIVARLHERPGAAAVPMLLGAGLNAVLACWWLDSGGPPAAAWAAGIGMYVGGGSAGLAYLLVTRTRLQRGTYVVMSAPALLALAVWLPTWVPGAAWAVLLAAGLVTNRLFSGEEKHVLAEGLRRILRPRR